MFLIINTMKKYSLFYTTFVLTIQKSPGLDLAPPSPLFVASPLLLHIKSHGTFITWS